MVTDDVERAVRRVKIIKASIVRYKYFWCPDCHNASETTALAVDCECGKPMEEIGYGAAVEELDK